MYIKLLILNSWLLLTHFVTIAQADSAFVTISINPFIDSTQISLHNIQNDTISMTLYNNLGQVMAGIMDSSIVLNDTSLYYNGLSLNNGVYFLKTTINDSSITTQLVKNDALTNLDIIRSKNNEISVWPNPVVNSLRIDCISLINQVTIYDIFGNIVKNCKTGNSVEVSSLSPGNYFLIIQTESDKELTRFIKK